MSLGRSCVVEVSGGENCDGCSKLPSVDKKRRAVARLIEAVCQFFYDKSRFLSGSERSGTESGTDVTAAGNLPRSLSDLGKRSENSAGGGQILLFLQGNSCSVTQKNGEIWTVQTDLQQIYPKLDRLLGRKAEFINRRRWKISLLRR